VYDAAAEASDAASGGEERGDIVKRESSELVEAAEGLEEELGRFEGIATEAMRSSLDSQKGLERAAQTLKNVVSAEERVAERVNALVAAVGRARARHYERAKAVEQRAMEIEARGKTYAGLMEDFAAIGTSATSVTQKLVAVGSASPADREAALATACDEVAALAARARELAERAAEESFGDVSRQAEGLRQQLLSGLNKIRLKMEN
jgi:hypothetical protein